MSEQRRVLRASRKKAQATQNLIMLVVGAGLVLISAAVFLALPSAQAEVQQTVPSVIPLAVNFPVPEVQLTDLNNQPVALADYQGQVILYNAWATWCPPCKEEMPTLEAYYQDYKQAGFVIVAIEDGQPVSEVAAFAESYKLSFPVWPDLKYVATTAFKTNSLPTSFVIDRSGTVRLTWTGAITRAALEKYVTPIISEQ
jgi:cytochrome c biogenesis protein CcmG, thiol:disulfide interchange protein DsbE